MVIGLVEELQASGCCLTMSLSYFRVGRSPLRAGVIRSGFFPVCMEVPAVLFCSNRPWSLGLSSHPQQSPVLGLLLRCRQRSVQKLVGRVRAQTVKYCADAQFPVLGMRATQVVILFPVSESRYHLQGRYSAPSWQLEESRACSALLLCPFEWCNSTASF